MKKAFSLQELVELTGADLFGDPSFQVSGVAPLESAEVKDVSFLANPKYQTAMQQSRAGVICIDRNTPPLANKNFLISDNPSTTFQQVAKKLLSLPDQRSGFCGIHPTAIVHESAKVGAGASIGPYSVIDADAIIGANTHIYPHVYVGMSSTIGERCTLYPHSVVRERCTLRDGVILQPGAVIGSCGFGYTTDPETARHTKLEQMGGVLLEEDVEVGANTTIDRARFALTIVKRGAKIDNLVQIAHNVEVGENNLIISQTGIAGSSKLGKNVFIGGQSGVVGHVTITDNVKVATRGGVSKSVTQSGIYGGGPLSPLPEFNRREVLLRKIGSFVKKLAALTKRVEELEEKK